MAQLTQPQNSGFQIDELPPAGTFVAVILDIVDLFGVERPKFENPAEKETLDVTRFLFGLQAQDGRLFKIQTREMRISGNPKAKLYQFLTGLLGHQPKYGWDYCELRGRPAMITVMHQQGRKDPSKTYANIATVAPLPHQLQNAVPPVAAFNYVREQAQAGGAPAAQPQQQPAVPQASYPANGYAPQQPQQMPPYPPQAPQQPPAYQYPMHLPQQPPAMPAGAQPSVQPTTQPPAAPTPAAPVQAPATAPLPSQSGHTPPPAPQQPPTQLWNPETDDPDEIPF